MSRNGDTQRLNLPVTPGLPTDADPGRTSCASRAASSVSPTIGLDPTGGRGPSPNSSALAIAERVAAPAPDDPLPLPPSLPGAPALPLPLAFLAGASAAAATLPSVPPSAAQPPVARRRLVPLPAARAGPTCVNTHVAPKQKLPFFDHCRHTPSRALAVIVGATVGWWTSALMRHHWKCRRGGGANAAPGWPGRHPPPGGTPSSGRRSPNRCADPG